ncbi:hypothetical protein ACPOL_6981 (plasmid) [Acidisarcina polymorpha]|uniref:Uncharacterized protein n=1 Tax=Acidisarcina polymorpha TaxID=2211140 RepID=A0A2Z5GC57_9BACT|nr:hypothetical protein ACPOL_6981 [Acidisarcina polymorpha]
MLDLIWTMFILSSEPDYGLNNTKSERFRLTSLAHLAVGSLTQPYSLLVVRVPQPVNENAADVLLLRFLLLKALLESRWVPVAETQTNSFSQE